MFSSKCKVILIETLFIGFLAALFLNIALYLFSMVADLPQGNFGLLGRWINMLIHGQFSTISISNEPAIPHEQAIGILGHLFTSCAFTFMYLLTCTCLTIRKIPPILSGVLFGLVLMVFPIFLEYPSMGVRVFGEQWPYITPNLLRIVTCHFFFGVGLGLGRLFLEDLRNARVSTAVV